MQAQHAAVMAHSNSCAGEQQPARDFASVFTNAKAGMESLSEAQKAHIKQVRKKTGFPYGNHIMPHDARQVAWKGTA